MKDWKNALALVALCIALVAVGCSDKSPSVAAPASPSSLTAPSIETPSDDQQLDTLRPTLTIRNGSGGNGARTYDFQIADNTNFSPVIAAKLSVAEGSSGKTSVTVDSDLTPSSRYYWRARMVEGGSATSWVSSKFKTKIGGYNRPGELVDVLSDGYTVGERFGSTTFIAGKGLQLNDANSYVRYQLPQTISSGEFSMEVEGLRPNGSRNKQTILSMTQGLGPVVDSSYELTAQYRGVPGNPDNCISFKAVWGSLAYKLEPNMAERSAAVMSLNPSTTYFWKVTWTATQFRLVIREGGVNGRVIYDFPITSSGGSYAPNPHTAYLGNNSGDGSFAGVIIRNVWLSGSARPASLGSAMGPQ